MEKIVSKGKVAKGGKNKVVKKLIESEVSDSASDMSSSLSPVELKPKATKSKKTTKAKKTEKTDCCIEDKPKKNKSKAKAKEDCVEECCIEDKPKKKAKVKKVKDPNAPKKELNPIMKEMNKFRNEVIGPIVGSKAPKLTIPPFKLALAAARSELGLGEKDKNTVETVQKAVELFQKDNSKYMEN